MRQVVGFLRAIDEREARAWYRKMVLDATIAGGEVEKTFEEVYPEFAEDEEVAISPETAKLMDMLAQKQLAELEAEQRGKSERTFN